MVSRTALRTSVPKQALPAFTPVPRKSPRHDGWTPERQRAFIEALADTGCVSIACRMVNMSQPSYYYLRRQPGAESFRAAADAAHTLGLQVVKDEAFDRAMHGQLVPVFVAGKLLGFRRKKNDRLLMFILRHYGQDATGRRTTINYFSTRATAGAQSSAPAFAGEGERACEAGPGGLLTAQPDAQHRLAKPLAQAGGGALSGAAADLSAVASAKAEASTTTVKTIISGPAAGADPLTADTEAANLINAFEGAQLDAEAQAEIYRALEACAERRRALEDDPENDPERLYIGERETSGWLGELESGTEGDWVEYRPEGEHLWENLGEGGGAAEIDEAVAGIEARQAAMTPEERAAEAQADRAAIEAQRAKQNLLPTPALSGVEGPEPDPDDPRLDWRNWGEHGYTPPSRMPDHPELACPGRACPDADQGSGEGPTSSSTSPKSPAPSPRAPRRAYKKRQPKPPFVPLELAPAETGEARKAQAIREVEAERREAARAEAERRKRSR